eukprot:268719-Rhodomonas_salina.5
MHFQSQTHHNSRFCFKPHKKSIERQYRAGRGGGIRQYLVQSWGFWVQLALLDGGLRDEAAAYAQSQYWYWTAHSPRIGWYRSAFVAQRWPSYTSRR